MGSFKITQKLDLKTAPVGTLVPESDFSTLVDDNLFVQMEYIADDKKLEPYPVKPGTWSIIKTMTGLELQETSFVKNNLLKTVVKTKEVTNKIDCFFRNLHVYYEEGYEVPKFGMLLYGQPGGGKTSAINEVATSYVKDGKTAVIVWTTDKFESFQVKDFIKSFEYKGVEKIILIVEDIGGTEIEQSRMRSDASLLSLLDNQEKTFSIPVLILATTNYPENLMGNLTNRPERFDEKISMPAPNAAERVQLLEFFVKGRDLPGVAEAIKLLGTKKADGFTPAHIKKIIISARKYEKGLDVVVEEMIKEVAIFKKGFEEQKGSLGIGFND